MSSKQPPSSSPAPLDPIQTATAKRLEPIIKKAESNKDLTSRLDFKNLSYEYFLTGEILLNFPRLTGGTPSPNYSKERDKFVQAIEKELSASFTIFATPGPDPVNPTDFQIRLTPLTPQTVFSNPVPTSSSSSSSTPTTPSSSVGNTASTFPASIAGTVPGLVPPQTTPAVPAPNPVISQPLSMTPSAIKSALGKARSGLDIDINEREFREILRKYPHIANLARRSAQEGLKSASNAQQMRMALQELIEVDEIQRSVYTTVDGEVPLRIKRARPVPISQQLVGRPWIRKPVGL